MSPTPDYLMSFTAAGLSKVSCVQMVSLFLATQDWSKARLQGLENNLLQTRTPTTGKRIWRELESRLKLLPVPAAKLLMDGTSEQQFQILWLALCGRYALVREFAIEVLRESALFGKRSVTTGDVEAFLFNKSNASTKIAKLSSTESVRVRRMLLLLSREAGLVDADGCVHPVLPDLEVARALGADFLAVWPSMLVTDSGLQEVRACL